jgi:hypothetical protein
VTVYLLAYEPRKEAAGVPWALEDGTGERRYFSRVVVEVDAETVIIPGPARPHAYLRFEGELHAEGQEAVIRKGRAHPR